MMNLTYINETIYAYIAGYIDGDGCIYLGKHIQKSTMIIVYEYSIQIVSVKKPVLDFFKRYFGGYIHKKPYKKNHRESFCWTLKGRKSAYLLQNIQYYLVEKKEQAFILQKFGFLIHHNQFKVINQTIIEERENLIKEIRKERHMKNLITKELIELLKEKQSTITPCEEDYAYLAGLIDSEGCFRIKKWKPKNKPNHVYNISLEIGNTKLPILPWLIERFGGNVCFIPAKKSKRDSALWTLSAAALYQILPKIRQFLTSKQEVCDKLIEFQKTILPNGGDRHSELFKALFEKRKEIRERIIAEVHEFNRKGSH